MVLLLGLGAEMTERVGETGKVFLERKCCVRNRALNNMYVWAGTDGIFSEGRSSSESTVTSRSRYSNSESLPPSYNLIF